MELLKQLITFLYDNEECITLSVNVLLGISTLVLTIVNLSLVRRQNEISEELSALESDRDQPYFRISLTKEKDNDGLYGTEILSVVNVGSHTLEPCDVDANMFLRLTKSNAENKV